MVESTVDIQIELLPHQNRLRVKAVTRLDLEN